METGSYVGRRFSVSMHCLGTQVKSSSIALGEPAVRLRNVSPQRPRCYRYLARNASYLQGEPGIDLRAHSRPFLSPLRCDRVAPAQNNTPCFRPEAWASRHFPRTGIISPRLGSTTPSKARRRIWLPSILAVKRRCLIFRGESRACRATVREEWRNHSR